MKLTLSNIAQALARANGHPAPDDYAKAVSDAAAQIDAEALNTAPAPLEPAEKPAE